MSQFTLACMKCGVTKDFNEPDGRAKGIQTWFDSVGKLCSKCRSEHPLSPTPHELGAVPQPLVYGLGGAETIQDAFEEFHALNPWVYNALVKLSRDLVNRGHRKIGIKMLFEVLRWQYMRVTDDPNSEFKLNNNYTARYARLIMDRESDLADAFEIRKLRAA